MLHVHVGCPTCKNMLRNHKKKRQRIVLKRLAKQRKHYLSLARKRLKNWENFKQNGWPEMFAENGRFLAVAEIY